MSRTGVLALLVSLVLAGPASAATFYVDDNAAMPASPCTDPDPEKACNTIQTAIEQARQASFPDGDVIQVAPGAYNEEVDLNTVADVGNTIVGAGSQGGPSGTLLNPVGVTGAVIETGASVLGVTLKDLRVEVIPAPPDEDRPGVILRGPNAALDNVAVDMTQAANSSAGISLTDIGVPGSFTLDRVSVGGAWDGQGISTAQAPSGTTLALRDSNVRSSGSSGDERALDVGAGWQVTVDRSLLQSPTANDLGTIFLSDSSLVLDSSVVLGGNGAVWMSGAAIDQTAVIRNSTMDGGTAGQQGAFAAVWLSDSGDSALIDSSIALEKQHTEIGATITCTNSDLPSQVQSPTATVGAIACGPSAGNTFTAPSLLFANAAAGDYHLRLGSPAIDTGSTAPPAAGESAIDRDGNPRVLDGNLDCVAQRDRGAFELTGQSAACPTPTQSDTNLAPVIQSLTVSNRVFRVKRGRGRRARPTSAARGRRAPVGTTFRYRLSEEARLTLTMARRTRGRRVGGVCRRVSRRNRGRPACRRWVRRGALRLTAQAGPNAKKFNGRLRGRALKTGRWRATARALDATGALSDPRSVRFRVVR